MSGSALGNVDSGKFGKVKKDGVEIAHITKWNATFDSDNPAYRSSSTGGATGRVQGNTDFNGSFEALINSDAPFDIVRGEYYTLELHKDATGNNYYECPSIIKSVQHGCEVESAKEQRAVANFEANGDYTKHGDI